MGTFVLVLFIPTLLVVAAYYCYKMFDSKGLPRLVSLVLYTVTIIAICVTIFVGIQR